MSQDTTMLHVYGWRPMAGIMMDPRNMKPIGAKCTSCHGQANVLIDTWTPDRPMEEYSWTCPRCRAANTILAPSKVVGVATAEGLLVTGKQAPN
jgi:hypothetical protein